MDDGSPTEWGRGVLQVLMSLARGAEWSGLPTLCGTLLISGGWIVGECRIPVLGGGDGRRCARVMSLGVTQNASHGMTDKPKGQGIRNICEA